MTSLFKKNGFKHRFDFDVGYLVKSPCKGCDIRPEFPRCIDGCKLLDRIHGRLAKSVSCTRRR
jgi:hypothetical protein